MERDPGEPGRPLGPLRHPDGASARHLPISCPSTPGPDPRLRRDQEGGGAGQPAAGALDDRRGRAIVRAADEVIDGQWREHFLLDAFQAGAGTSTNMNVNEVIANRALQLLGHGRGDYSQLHPNDTSTDRSRPTTRCPPRCASPSLRLLGELARRYRRAGRGLRGQGARVGRGGQGRPHAPARRDADDVGQESAAYADNVRRAGDRLRTEESTLAEVPIGGTAIGTGINTPTGFAALRRPPRRDHRPAAARGAGPHRLQQSIGDFVAASGALRGLAVSSARSLTTCAS